MKFFSIINGTIIHRDLIEPENKKPYFKYQLLQSMPGMKANLIDIKDKSIERELKGEVSLITEVMDWNFNGKTGISVNVIEPHVEHKELKSSRKLS